MNFCPQFFYPVSPELSDCLKSLGHFTWLPSPGHAGDALIATASQLLFERMELSFEHFDNMREYPSGYTLVYGGGELSPDWGYLPWLQQVFTSPAIRRCVILPQSLHYCPELLALMDERFTVFLREKQSYDYAVSHNSRAQFHLAEDMAFCLEPSHFAETLRKRVIFPSYISYRLARWRQNILKQNTATCARTIHLYRVRNTIQKRIDTNMPRCMQALPDGTGIAWLLRADRQRKTEIRPQAEISFDLALVHGNVDMNDESNMLISYHFLQAINRADIIITDRLHVAIGAALLGKQLVMLDNRRGLLSPVWEESMKQLPHVHFCHADDAFAATLQQAIRCHRQRAAAPSGHYC